VPGDFATLQTPCPKCGGLIKENYKKFQCQACDYSLWKIVASRQFEISEIETLLSTGKVGPLMGFRNKMGRGFNAEIKLNDDKMPEFDFGQPREDETGEPPDFSDQKSLGPCPKCANGVYEHGMAFVCEKSLGAGKSCDFRSGKVILQQPIEREQMEKLLSTGRTDLLTGFISARTRRKFSAFLVRGADGKVSFEFEKREPKAKAVGAKAAAKPKAAVKDEAEKPAPVKAAPKKAVAKKATTAKTAAAKKPAASKAKKPSTAS
jgi:DNA topoisomerase-3